MALDGRRPADARIFWDSRYLDQLSYVLRRGFAPTKLKWPEFEQAETGYVRRFRDAPSELDDLANVIRDAWGATLRCSVRASRSRNTARWIQYRR